MCLSRILQADTWLWLKCLACGPEFLSQGNLFILADAFVEFSMKLWPVYPCQASHSLEEHRAKKTLGSGMRVK